MSRDYSKTGNYRKLYRYWKKVEDPFYYNQVSSYMRSALADVAPSKEEGRAGYDCEFTNTTRILAIDRTLPKQTENNHKDD